MGEMIFRIGRATMCLIFVSGAASTCSPQTNPSLQTYFKDYIGLTDEQIANIRAGHAFAKNLHSRTADEIFVFGAVYVNAAPESYLQFARDFNRLRSVPGFLAVKEFSDPPQLSDVKDMTFDSEDLKELKNCKPGDCKIQMPASSIEEVHKLSDWSAPNVEDQVEQLLHKRVVDRVTSYQREGNEALGTYNDKRNPTEVPEQFKYMLSYSRALPKYLPDFYRYLLSYPAAEPANVENSFYWARVKFGLKPTLRVVHVVTMLHGNATVEPVYAIAEKQLYSSHYFETALDLTFCVRDVSDPKATGFYLIKAMGSEQAGLTGFKGSIVRKVATDRSAASLQKSLSAIKDALEHGQ
jgi:hypothetical protein